MSNCDTPKMAAPCALIVSCCSAVKSEDFMKQIIAKDELPEGKIITDGIVGYPWLIDNKYYTANVQLCTTPQRTIGNQEFAESLEAIVIACSDQKNSFESVKQWLPYIHQLNPEILILACEQFSKSNEISREELAVWCLDHSFELVELQLSEEDEEYQDEFDITGTKRIVSALHAHMWSNLEMKEERHFNRINLDSVDGTKEMTTQSLNSTVNNETNSVSCQSRTEIDDETTSKNTETDSQKTIPTSSHQSPDGDGASSEKKTTRVGGETSTGASQPQANTSQEEKTVEDRIDSLLGEDMKLFEALGNEDPGGESFEQLFSRMSVMKERAASLPEEERKKYAEKVAIAFWRAMGGDEEEINGLDDDSD